VLLRNLIPEPQGGGRGVFRKRILILVTIVVAIVLGVVGFYAWDYRRQTLIDDTVSIKEQQTWQFGLDLSFGGRDVQVSIETYNIPIYATLWWQSGTEAVLYVQHQPVGVNSTWTASVTLRNSGGQYSIIVSKNELYGEGLTTIHVRIAA
jgi:hypothetical protein